MKKLIPVAAAAGLIIAGLALATSGSLTAVEYGMARGVDPDASAIDSGQSRTLRVGDDVAIGETIETGPTGQVQLLFDDKTELVIGPKSKLRIDDYLIRNDGSAGKFAIAALSGTFRFVTGASPHNTYQISTPTGTIGVRGTAFDFSVLPALFTFLDISPDIDVVTSLLLFNGAVDLCNLAGVCVEVSNICGFGVASTLEAVVVDNTRDNRGIFRPFFPYALDQSPLLQPFRVANARQCISPPPSTGTTTPSLTSPGGPVPTETVAPTTTTPESTTTTTTTTVTCTVSC